MLHAPFLSILTARVHPPPPLDKTDPERKPPFEDGRAGKKADSSTWGNFDSIEEPKVVLNFATRKVRILEEIVRNSPDIVALQEMDRYHDYFGPVLEHLGYESKWSCKLVSGRQGK